MERTERMRKIWWIALALALALALVVAAGFLAGSARASLDLAAFLMTIMLLATAVADHGWRAVVRWTLIIIGALACIIFGVAAFATGGYVFVAFALVGGTLYSTYWVLGGVRLPRSRITGAMLLPPRRRRGATLVSVIVAMGIVTVTMTMALRAHYQSSRFAALEAQRTVAAAECQAQLELTRARGWSRLPGVGEHEFHSEAGGGELTIAPGPVASSRRITARVDWPRRDDIPAGGVELVTIMSARGAGG